MTWVPRSTHSRGRVVFEAAFGSSTSYAAAIIDARALGRYLRRSRVLELPAKARQAILRRMETAAGPQGLGTPNPAHTSVPDLHRGGGGGGFPGSELEPPPWARRQRSGLGLLFAGLGPPGPGGTIGSRQTAGPHGGPRYVLGRFHSGSAPSGGRGNTDTLAPHVFGGGERHPF